LHKNCPNRRRLQTVGQTTDGFGFKTGSTRHVGEKKKGSFRIIMTSLAHHAPTGRTMEATYRWLTEGEAGNGCKKIFGP
jgi:hypothetical protein